MSPGLPTHLLLPLLRCFYLGESYTLHSIRNGFTSSLLSFLKLAVRFVERRQQWMRLSLDVQLPVEAPLEYTVLFRLGQRVNNSRRDEYHRE